MMKILIQRNLNEMFHIVAIFFHLLFYRNSSFSYTKCNIINNQITLNIVYTVYYTLLFYFENSFYRYISELKSLIRGLSRRTQMKFRTKLLIKSRRKKIYRRLFITSQRLSAKILNKRYFDVFRSLLHYLFKNIHRPI